MRPGWAPRDLRRFAQLRPEVEVVAQRCGLGTVDLLLIDREGQWRRGVVASTGEAQTMARDLGVRLHDGWDDPRLARRMNARDRWAAPEGRRHTG